jgi:hypothetical protein
MRCRELHDVEARATIKMAAFNFIDAPPRGPKQSCAIVRVRGCAAAVLQASAAMMVCNGLDTLLQFQDRV